MYHCQYAIISKDLPVSLQENVSHTLSANPVELFNFSSIGIAVI